MDGAFPVKVLNHPLQIREHVVAVTVVAFDPLSKLEGLEKKIYFL